MSIVEYTGPSNPQEIRKYLMRRTKDQIVWEYLRLWREYGNLEKERDALSAQLTDERRNTDEAHYARRSVMAERDAALEREQALTALVERARPMIEAYRGQIGGALWALDDEELGFAKEAEAWLSTSPDASLTRMKDERAQAIQQAVKQARLEWVREDKAALDRLKARWQAEVLEEFIKAASWETENSLLPAVARGKAAELRRQAELGD